MILQIDSSIMGGLCLASENIADDDNNKSTISDTDVVSLYPYVMTQKLPISNYKFVSKFDRNQNMVKIRISFMFVKR